MFHDPVFIDAFREFVLKAINESMNQYEISFECSSAQSESRKKKSGINVKGFEMQSIVWKINRNNVSNVLLLYYFADRACSGSGGGGGVGGRGSLRTCKSILKIQRKEHPV